VTDDDLLAFIATSIGSVWAIELLLLLRHDPARGWDAEALVRELRSSAVVIDDALARLFAAGLIIRDGGGVYRYRAASSRLDQLASELEEVYATKPMTVIRAIASGHE
jgi:hypothetical protein